MSATKYPVKHLSNSSIKLFSNCPFAFKTKYLMKFKQPSNEHFALGKSVHGAMEFQIRFRMKHSKDLPLQVLQDNYRKKMAEEATALKPKQIQALREMHESGFELVEQCYWWVKKNNPIATEKRFQLNFGYDLPILGYIDLLMPDGLLDAKTCSKPWPKSKLDNDVQLTIYNEAYHLLFDEWPKTLGILELDKKEVLTNPSNAARVVTTHRNSVHRDKLDMLVDAVLKGMRDNRYPRCNKKNCFACEAF